MRSFFTTLVFSGVAIVAGAFLVHEAERPKKPLTALPPFDSTSVETNAVKASEKRSPAQVAPSVTERKGVKNLFKKVEQLNICYQTKCDYPKTYPRDYEFAVGRDIKKELYAIASLVERDGLVDVEISHQAREFLVNDDGHVKEAALHLIATQPPSEENLRAILGSVISDIDAQLIEHAMMELGRYKSPEHLDLIHKSLANALVTGAPFVAQAISTRLLPFINSTSYSFFMGLGQQLPADSAAKANLTLSLGEYRRRQKGA